MVSSKHSSRLFKGCRKKAKKENKLNEDLCNWIVWSRKKIDR